MNILRLQNSGRLFFSIANIAEILKIAEGSARVLASRYVSKGLLTRIKKNVYTTKNVFIDAEQSELFQLSSILQTPSYVSFMTALSYYEVTTQVTRSVVECVSKVRTAEYDKEGVAFTYRCLKKELFFGFERKDGFFIAEPEKAFLDCVYLMSQGTYNLDIESIDIEKFSKEKLRKYSRKFNKKTRALVLQINTTK